MEKNKMRILFVLLSVLALNAETLFEVKDASNQKVMVVSTDGLRILNQGDTLMVISPAGVRVNLDNNPGKALSRTFAVTTTSSKNKGLSRVLEVGIDETKIGTQSTVMGVGGGGGKYSDMSPVNMFLGLNAGASIAGAKYNIFIGNYSGYTTTGPEEPDMFEYGYYNTFLGFESGRNATNSAYNTYIGSESGKMNTDGTDNTFVGCSSGVRNTGYSNTIIGAFSGSGSGNGNSNTFMGMYAGTANTNGSYNTFIGQGAGEGNYTGNSNVYLGAYSGGANHYGSGNVCLGNSAGSEETGSNKLYIDNSNTSTPLIYGDFSSDLVRINGKFGVGVSPLYKIHSEDVTLSSDAPAVYGKHAVTDNYGIGVKGESKWKGVEGYTQNASGNGYALYGYASGIGTGDRIGVFGTADGGTSAWAGYFAGNVNVTGTVVKSKEEVKVDHPLDPENKFLVHSGVGSSEMLNIYNGNALLGKDGTVVVELPEWFEAYNKDFRYQLTPVGSPAMLYIAEKIKNNSFKIAGGTEGLEVSWQITGVRKDSFASKNPIENEVKKNEIEKGFYLHPESFGVNPEKSIEYKKTRIDKKVE
jgi:hypothetical protein